MGPAERRRDHYDAARIYLTNRSFLTEDGTVPAQHARLRRSAARIGGGMHEDLDITNHGRKPVRFNLEIAIRSDFADIFEVKQQRIVRRGRISTEWSEAASGCARSIATSDFMRARARSTPRKCSSVPSTPTAG